MARAREAETRLRVNSRKLSPELRRARGKWKKFGKGVEKDLTKSFGGVRSTIGKLAGFAGVAGFAALGRDVIDFEGKLKRLEIQGGRNNVNLAKFRAEILAVSNATGRSRNELIDAASRFTELTGDVAGAQKNLELFAKIATGTGAEMNDIVSAAVAIRKQFRGIDSNNLEKAFDILVVQGKAGSVEIKDVAEQLGQLGSGFQSFGKNTEEGLATLGAAFQVIQTEFGFDPAKARTALNSLFVQLNKNGKALEKFTKAGDFDKRTGEFKDLFGIVESLEKKGATFGELLGIFKEAKAARTVQALIRNLKEARKIRDDSLKASAIQADFTDFQASAAGRLATAWERIKNVFLKVMTPDRIERIADAFEGLLNALSFVVDNMGSLITIFAGAQIFKFTRGIKALGEGLIENGQAIGPLVAKFGSLAGAIGLAVAAAGALQLAFDALDKRQEKSIKQRAEVGFVAQQTGQFGGFRRQAFKGGVGLSKQEKFAARTLADELRRRDVFEPGTTRVSQKGKAVLRQQAEKEAGVTNRVERDVTKDAVNRRTVELIRAAEFAATRASVSEQERQLTGRFPEGAPAVPGAAAQNFVEIRVEPGSLIKVTETENSKRKRRRR